MGCVTLIRTEISQMQKLLTTLKWEKQEDSLTYKYGSWRVLWEHMVLECLACFASYWVRQAPLILCCIGLSFCSKHKRACKDDLTRAQTLSRQFVSRWVRNSLFKFPSVFLPCLKKKRKENHKANIINTASEKYHKNLLGSTHLVIRVLGSKAQQYCIYWPLYA